MDEAQYRFTVGYLLCCYAGTLVYARFSAPARPLNRARSVLNASCLVTPLVAYLCLPGATLFAALDFPDVLRVDPIRLIAILPAAATILLLVWTHRSWAGGEDSPAEFSTAGPFRWVRYPGTAAEFVFFSCLAIITLNALIQLMVAIGVVTRQRQVAAEEERRLHTMGADYQAYMNQTGQLFFKPGSLKAERYSIPRRFGLSAAATLITTFGFLFGALNYMEAPPAVYLFCAFEIVAICLGQILFGSAPRSSSCVAGALTLPLCVWLTTTRPGWMAEEVYWMCLGFLFFFGGLLGYCLGALAAGFFLVMDLIEPYLPGAEASES